MPTKKPRTTIYLEPELMEALEERAKQEKRTVSNMCNLLLEQAMSEWLKQKGK
ncbi:ribbon-helix-helix domain-containing protein [Brunnivagina elsteri]|uniref:ribbon-helix-helix domain-containing protein n=1 Tax=Brunnivagina elsteri TaxID=1247191 RepID=UPI001FE3FC38|nr:ribbon-helix-helix protein, CopG family [Calothrix elsteri]